MLPIIGLVIIFGCVFGIYIASGGKIDIILHALPHELGMIMGASIGAYMITNSCLVLKKTFKEIMVSVKGVKWKKQDYKDFPIFT